MTEKRKPQAEIAYEKKLMVQLTKEMWQDLRRVGFELDISMAQLCREGIKHMLDKHKKYLGKK